VDNVSAGQLLAHNVRGPELVGGTDAMLAAAQHKATGAVAVAAGIVRSTSSASAVARDAGEMLPDMLEEVRHGHHPRRHLDSRPSRGVPHPQQQGLRLPRTAVVCRSVAVAVGCNVANAIRGSSGSSRFCCCRSR
jgi:hypothetical protein